MSTGPCPKVPARWPSVQFGLPRPAGAGSMKPKPDKGGDPAKCLSVDSSKHTPLPVQPTCTRVHTCTHTHPSRSLRSSLLMGLGVLLLQPNAPKTTVHSAEVQALLRGLSKAPTEPWALLTVAGDESDIGEGAPKTGWCRETAENSGVGRTQFFLESSELLREGHNPFLLQAYVAASLQ